MTTHPDEAVKQVQWLLDVAYKQAVHDVGLTDWSTATADDKRQVNIMKCVILKETNKTVNNNKLVDVLGGIRNAISRGNLS